MIKKGLFIYNKYYFYAFNAPIIVNNSPSPILYFVSSNIFFLKKNITKY